MDWSVNNHRWWHNLIPARKRTFAMYSDAIGLHKICRICGAEYQKRIPSKTPMISVDEIKKENRPYQFM